MDEAAKLQAIYRYPVKGLSPEPLQGAELAVGGDHRGRPPLCRREWALRLRPGGAPLSCPSSAISCSCATSGWPMLRTRFDEASHTLVIEAEGREAARGDLRTPAGRAAIERFLAAFCADELRGPPKVLHAPGFSFSDVARKVLSIINLASVAAVEDGRGSAGPPAALPRQSLRDRLAGLARVRSGRAGDRDRIGRAAQDRQAHRALRRHQRRPRHRHPRPLDSRHADAELRPRRLRGLRRGGEGRRDRGRRSGDAAESPWHSPARARRQHGCENCAIALGRDRALARRPRLPTRRSMRWSPPIPTISPATTRRT